MEYFKQIEAMHEQVRKFVEEQEPDFKVVSVDGYSGTSYMPPLHGQGEISPKHAEFVLTEIKLRFRVDARYLASNKRGRLDCDVYVTSDGKLYMADQVLIR
jgi:hypothetical protein